MKILSVIASLNPAAGGTTQAVRTLHEAWLAAGHESTVVACDAPESEWLAAWGGAAHGVGAGRYGWAWTRGLAGWLAGYRGDAVLVHGLWLYPSLAVRRSGLRYFVFPHGMLDPWFQRARGRRLKAIRNWWYWRLIEERVVASAAGLLFTCEQEMRLAATTFRPYRPKAERVVGLGIEPPPAESDGMREAFVARCPEVVGRPFLLFLGRIDPKKGVAELMAAHAQVGSELLIVVAGPGLESAYGRELRRRASRWFLFPGMLAGAAKWGALFGCDALILPSHQENFGISVVEALACGKPVLISDQVNIWREIQEGRAGLVAPDTVAGAAELLTRYSALSMEQREEMGRSARRCYARYFTASEAAARVVEAISMP